MSHNSSATPRYTGSPEGPARQQPGDALRLQLRTQNGSEPQPVTRIVRTVLCSLQSAGPPRATPQAPSSVSSCVKWGFNACRLEGCSFSALCSMATSSLSKPSRFTAVDAAVPTGLPRRRTHTCWGPRKLPPAARCSWESHFTARWDTPPANGESQGPAHRLTRRRGGPSLGGVTTLVGGATRRRRKLAVAGRRQNQESGFSFSGAGRRDTAGGKTRRPEALAFFDAKARDEAATVCPAPG